MSELILHLGIPKTGSSTVQRLLEISKPLLAKEGIGYAYDSGSSLVSYANNKATNYSPPWLADRLRYDRFILSAERLFSKTSRLSSAERAVKAISGHFDRICAFCYIRRQDEIIVSGYSTYLLNGGTLKFAEWNPPLWPIYERLALWADVIGWDNIQVRKYGRQYFQGGNLVEDFLSALRIPPHAVINAENANVSPATEIMEYQRLLNSRIELTPERRAFAKTMFAMNLPGTPLGMSRKRRMEIVSAQQAGYDKIAGRFFGGGQLFSHEFPDNETRDVHLTTDDIVAITRQVAAAYDHPPDNLVRILWDGDNAEHVSSLFRDLRLASRPTITAEQ